jgi:hypothetical protein
MHSTTIAEVSRPFRALAWRSSFQPTNQIQEPTKVRQHTHSNKVSCLLARNSHERTHLPFLKLHAIFALSLSLSFYSLVSLASGTVFGVSLFESFVLFVFDFDRIRVFVFMFIVFSWDFGFSCLRLACDLHLASHARVFLGFLLFLFVFGLIVCHLISHARVVLDFAFSVLFLVFLCLCD